MKTKLYKSYAAATKTATTESIFVGSSDEQRFAHRAGLLDAGDQPLPNARSPGCRTTSARCVSSACSGESWLPCLR